MNEHQAMVRRALSEPEPAPRRSRRREVEPEEELPVEPEEDALVYEVSETGEATGNIPEDVPGVEE